MLSTTIQILIYFGVALFGIALSVIIFTIIGYVFKLLYNDHILYDDNKRRLPTFMTPSGNGDPEGLAQNRQQLWVYYYVLL